jgi:hypothetical protein
MVIRKVTKHLSRKYEKGFVDSSGKVHAFVFAESFMLELRECERCGKVTTRWVELEYPRIRHRRQSGWIGDKWYDFEDRAGVVEGVRKETVCAECYEGEG